MISSRHASKPAVPPRSLCVRHVVAAVDESGHGVAEAVIRLAAAEAAVGADVVVETASPAGRVTGLNVRSHRHEPLPAFALMRSPELRFSLLRSASAGDVIHAHNLWTMPVAYAAEAAEAVGCPLVCSTHGALDPHSLHVSRTKKAAWWLWQRRVLARIDLFHAASEHEAQHLRRRGLRAPVAVIPHGVDVPAAVRRPHAAGPRSVGFLGRLHRIKGVDRLLRAWHGTAAERPDWQLRICGPNGGASRELRALAKGMPRVTFEPAVTSAEKSAWLMQCDLVVLPSHGENFGMVVAEALAHGIPVIASTGTPWQGIAEHGCGWWTDNDVASLRTTLLAATSLDEAHLLEMGRRGRDWMIRDFSWRSVADQMLAAYRWLQDSTGRPPCVVTG